MTDYKNRELNLFSSDAKSKLRVTGENNSALGSDVFKFVHGMAEGKSGAGEVSGNMPVYIPKLAADVGGTAVYISDWLWQSMHESESVGRVQYASMLVPFLKWL